MADKITWKTIVVSGVLFGFILTLLSYIFTAVNIGVPVTIDFISIWNNLMTANYIGAGLGIIGIIIIGAVVVYVPNLVKDWKLAVVPVLPLTWVQIEWLIVIVPVVAALSITIATIFILRRRTMHHNETIRLQEVRVK